MRYYIAVLKRLAVSYYILAILLPWIYGLSLGFKASVILGVAFLIIPPLPAILGWLAIFGMFDICQKTANLLHLPF